MNWSEIPKLAELEQIINSTIVKSNRYGFLYPHRVKLTPNQFLVHDTRKVEDVVDLYERNGFETKQVIQDPFGHSGPTSSLPIGFPSSLPENYAELVAYRKWICRLHIDICRGKADAIVSVPHVEPDPYFHKWTHFYDTYLKGRVVRGEVSVTILRRFLNVE